MKSSHIIIIIIIIIMVNLRAKFEVSRLNPSPDMEGVPKF